MIKYSIVIPHYNDKVNLLRLLKSIGRNKFIETIVVDDKSDLNSSEIERIKGLCDYFLINEGSKNAGTCRNLGIEHCKGTWVIFADSDDMFEIDYMDILDKEVLNLDNSVDIVYFSPISNIINNDALGTRHIFYESLIRKYIEENCDFVRYKFHVPWSKLIRRDFIIDNSIFFDEVIASNDILFSLKVGVNANTIKCSYLTYYNVTERSGSLTSSPTYERMQSRLSAIIRYNDYLYLNEKKSMQMPLTIVIKSFYKYFDKKMALKLLLGLIIGKYKLFPGRDFFKVRDLKENNQKI